jgi:hypothetical protein
VLIDACLANEDVRRLITDPESLLDEQDCQANPIVRVDYNQAFAIATIGEGIYATRNKKWGDGPNILPLEPFDPVDDGFILYVYKENSIYNRRFEQRKRLKELLGKRYRTLVEKAKCMPQVLFLEELTAQQAYVIRRSLQMEPVKFWRLCRGKELVRLPKSPAINPEWLPKVEEKPKQQLLPFTDLVAQWRWPRP